MAVKVECIIGSEFVKIWFENIEALDFVEDNFHSFTPHGLNLAPRHGWRAACRKSATYPYCNTQDEKRAWTMCISMQTGGARLLHLDVRAQPYEHS
jgi:hypothetical protein